MLERDIITKKQYETSINEPLGVVKSKVNYNQYYNNVIDCLEKLNFDYKNKSTQVAVTLPIDKILCKKVEEIINECACDYNVNVIIAENTTGDVLCNMSTFKYDVSKARFMPGSTIKPILCYAPLLEENLIYTVSSVNDKPYSIGSYSPENFNKKYRGNITQREALAYSSNSVALQNLERIGLQKAVNFAQKSGLNFSDADKDNYAIALGGVKYGFTLNELLTSYMCIARNGNKITPSYVNCIDKNKKIVFSSCANGKNIMKEETAFLLSEMLRDCADYGTAKTLKKHKNVRAKTGTVGDKNGNSECYCIAFSPAYTVLCHVSKNENPLPLNIMGGTLPTRIVDEIFEYLNDKTEFRVPDDIVEKDIMLSKLKDGNVVLAPFYEREINKKSCFFSRDNIPEYQNNSYNDFIEKYDLAYSYEFDIFDSFIN